MKAVTEEGHRAMATTRAPAHRTSGAPPRPVIENIRPMVECGRFPAKAAVGDAVTVEADAFADGHDLLLCELRYQRDGESTWTTVRMEQLVNDRWRGTFLADRVGRCRFVVRADVDRFATWRRDLWARPATEAPTELIVGAGLVADAAERARGGDRRVLEAAAACLAAARSLDDRLDGLGGAGAAAAADLEYEHDGTVGGVVRSEELARLVRRYRAPGTSVSSVPCPLVVEPALARFGSWYELFPRSAAPGPGRAGTLADVVDRLGYLERLAVDVLYLPPVHPIGTTGRKGADGATVARPDDPGSPWAIGSHAGGHTAVDPALGTLEDFHALVAAAAERNIAVAIDLAFQCSPDHPWVSEHPEWFRHRPDGSIRYAENPPKRYEDIFPLDFETEAWWQLWQELLRVVRFWVGHGVRVFRVDNPHTKPFAFWEWLISSVKADHPEVLFLSEAFTRPKVMNRLAKVGFSQSYTYFAWRTTKWELETYMADLAEAAEFFRPNFWPNTPDILTETLQTGGTGAFVERLVLAATLSASYGIYGPAFELQEHVARIPGSEEYAGSEKYAVRHWDLDRPDSLAPLVGRVNEIRRQHPALQRNDTLVFHRVDNDQLVAYSKTSGDDRVLVVVNLDPFHRQSGWVELDAGDGIDVHDLLTGARYRWAGERNFVILDPQAVPAHVFHVTVPGPPPTAATAATAATATAAAAAAGEPPGNGAIGGTQEVAP